MKTALSGELQDMKFHNSLLYASQITKMDKEQHEQYFPKFISTTHIFNNSQKTLVM